MTPQLARTQSPDEIYELLRLAATRRQPVAAIYHDLPRLLCPHVLGRGKDGHLRASAIRLEATVAVACGRAPMDSAAGAASRWTNSAKSSCRTAIGEPNLTPAGRVVSSKSISMPMFSRSGNHKTGSEPVAVAASVPVRCEASRWNADYAARAVFGDDPRGRKSGAVSGATNPRWPARAEGEKRFRSAMRNP